MTLGVQGWCLWDTTKIKNQDISVSRVLCNAVPLKSMDQTPDWCSPVLFYGLNMHRNTSYLLTFCCVFLGGSSLNCVMVAWERFCRAGCWLKGSLCPSDCGYRIVLFLLLFGVFFFFFPCLTRGLRNCVLYLRLKLSWMKSQHLLLYALHTLISFWLWNKMHHLNKIASFLLLFHSAKHFLQYV